MTTARVEGLCRGMPIIGRWKSADGKTCYMAIGMLCDAKAVRKNKLGAFSPTIMA
jgi:hypothetical protein